MQSNSFSNNDDRNDEPAKRDTSAAEKEKLLREIQDLKCLIKQCEWSLQTLHFKDVEKHVAEKFPRNLEVPSRFSRTQNVQVDLQYDLYRFAGFQCVKFRRDGCVFNFTSTNEDQKDNTNAIQIFIKDEKASLGNWVMPMSIDMNYLLSKTPIDNLKNLTPFIKNCKHNVDCYFVRQEQFLSLKAHISNMKHCTLHSDIGFKRFSLELYGIHDIGNDRYINLIISLLYHSDKARPHKIEFDTTDNIKLHDDMKQNLKLCLKEFKKSDLQTAFDKMMKNNSRFTWTQSDDESPLELNNTSNSDEEDFLTQLQSNQRKSLRIRQKKRKLQKKWNLRKRQRNTVNESSENEQEDGHSKAKVSHTGSPQQIPIRKKKARKVTSKQEKINEHLPKETTPLHEPKVKLKQTKLNFQNRESTNSNEMSLFESNSIIGLTSGRKVQSI